MTFQFIARMTTDYYIPRKWVLQFYLLEKETGSKNMTPKPVLTDCWIDRFLREDALL